MQSTITGRGLRWLRHRDHIQRTWEFSILHGAAVALTLLVVLPIQKLALGDLYADAPMALPALLFLPAIVKALAAWMYRWWAILYILPTALVQHLFAGFSLDWGHVLELSVYLVSAPLVIGVLGLLGLNCRLCQRLNSWRVLLCIVVVSSAILASFRLVFHYPEIAFGEGGLFLSLSVASDLAGSLLVLSVLMAFFRARERKVRTSHIRTEA